MDLQRQLALLPSKPPSIEKKVEEMHKERALQSYEAVKLEAPEVGVQPEKWDYGTAANNVYAKDAA